MSSRFTHLPPFAHLRVARPTDQLDRIAAMYRDGLGFDVIADWRDHEGVDGTVLAHRELSYQIEFTQEPAHPVGRAPTEDNLLVFYILDAGEWSTACERMLAAGFEPVSSRNPYWNRGGRTFEDADGYRVVMFNGSWPTYR